MYDRTLAIYCFIDDLLKAMQHSEDSRCEFSDSEVVTTAIVAMLFFGGNFERSHVSSFTFNPLTFLNATSPVRNKCFAPSWRQLAA